MTQFNYIELETKPNNPIDGDLYYDKFSFVIYIYKKNIWINIDEYTDDFESYYLKYNRHEKLEYLNKISKKVSYNLYN